MASLASEVPAISQRVLRGCLPPEGRPFDLDQRPSLVENPARPKGGRSMSTQMPSPPPAPPAPPSPRLFQRPSATLVIGLVVGVLVGSGLTAAVTSGDESPELATPSLTGSVSQSPSDITSPSPTDPVVEPSPSDEFEFTELSFGDSLSVETDDGAEQTLVTVEQPTLAKCQFGSIGCSKPETGDRVAGLRRNAAG
jgi:hypothetical protein